MTSKYLNQNALKGLARIGDILIPGNEEFPSFSVYRCLDHVDDLIEYVPKGDVKDLNMVLVILSFLPGNVLRWLVKQMANAHNNQSATGPLLRELNIGIRGIVFSLYYSEKPGHNYTAKNPTELIGFTLNKVM